MLAGLALPAALAAQGGATVRGRVTDAEGNAPVVAAQVMINGTRLGSATTPNGDFVITNVPAGNQTVRIVRYRVYAPRATGHRPGHG